MSILNLGILAHVDAGKTSLTERLLHAAGVIDEIGRVDHGSTRTDSLALERERGITIRSAVVSFEIGGRTVNLIDTPGHPDFIAEVERVLGVLDGAVLVVSAVEGVQAQTRILMRTLRRLRIPTLVFVNKIDRGGADAERVVRDVAAKLTPDVVAMGTAVDQGTRRARYAPHTTGPEFVARLVEVLSTRDDAILGAYVDDGVVAHRRLRRALVEQAGRAQVHPVFLGSAITGAGIDALMAGITEFLPAAARDDRPVAGTVFKVERGRDGEKIAYARLFAGTLHTRDRLRFGVDRDAKVTGIEVFHRGAAERRPSVSAGEIARLWGLGDVRVGDPIGASVPAAGVPQFAPPTLESVVVPAREADRGALHVALTHLAEQDPLIDLRHDGRETSVTLYGEVQKEVIAATLTAGYGLAVTFHETTTICVERVLGTGTAVEVMGEDVNPFLATVGLRVEPAAVGAGIGFGLEIEPGALPLAFRTAIEETVRHTLDQGIHGWSVPDATVTLTRSGYAPRQSHAHATFDQAMSSTAGDFRLLTPLVLMAALGRAGTAVHEPVHRFVMELPVDTLGMVVPALSRMRAVPGTPTVRGTECTLHGEIPAARTHELQQRLPGLTRGEGVLDTAFSGHRPVRGAVPARPRTDHDPLDRAAYLLRVVRRV